MLVQAGVGSEEELTKRAFGDFLSESTATASQIEFINLIMDQLVALLGAIRQRAALSNTIFRSRCEL